MRTWKYSGVIDANFTFKPLFFTNIENNHKIRGYMKLTVYNGTVTNKSSLAAILTYDKWYSRHGNAFLLAHNGFLCANQELRDYVALREGILYFHKYRDIKFLQENTNNGTKWLTGTGLLAAGHVTNQGVVTAIGPCANKANAETNTDGIYNVSLSNLSHTNYYVQITPHYDVNDGRGFLMPSIMEKTISSFKVRLQSTNGGLYQEPFDFVVYGSLTND